MKCRSCGNGEAAECYDCTRTALDDLREEVAESTKKIVDLQIRLAELAANPTQFRSRLRGKI